MVGHESWENVVQAAPVMAVLLNKTLNASADSPIDTTNKIITQDTTITSSLSSKK